MINLVMVMLVTIY